MYFPMISYNIDCNIMNKYKLGFGWVHWHTHTHTPLQTHLILYSDFVIWVNLRLLCCRKKKKSLQSYGRSMRSISRIKSNNNRQKIKTRRTEGLLFLSHLFLWHKNEHFLKILNNLNNWVLVIKIIDNWVQLIKIMTSLVWLYFMC